ncbi:hypothetical protein CERZMDRAFT_100462 [Cercospora zeae-maydis SCOH1-5]|uniref:Transmembrane protein n=1 Tax=Cercospora zeae-maydis SCOH1-5 TaxID=717836 RepID=A0A6A6F8I8_9PEZI|nr:hypothetical protein CERZMDRAFT_100462 [Cercospora zeae-maydis SCOH1-5]
MLQLGPLCLTLSTVAGFALLAVFFLRYSTVKISHGQEQSRCLRPAAPMSQNDPLLALPLEAGRNAVKLSSVGGGTELAPDREWSVSGEENQFASIEDTSLGRQLSLKNKSSTQDDATPGGPTALSHTTTQLSECSVTVTAACPTVTIINETGSCSQITLSCCNRSEMSRSKLGATCIAILVLGSMAYASLKFFLQRCNLQGAMDQATKTRGPQNSAQGDSCRFRGRSEDLAAGATMHSSVLARVVSAAGRRLREGNARPWADISGQELSAGVLAMLQGLTDVILPESVDEQFRETPFLRQASPEIVVGTTGEGEKLGLSEIHSCTIEPDHGSGEVSIQLHDGDEEANGPPQRAPELQTILPSCSNVHYRPGDRLHDARNATIREQSSPSEHEINLQFEHSTSSDEPSPVSNRSHMADDLPEMSSNAAMSESDSISNHVGPARDPDASDGIDVTWLQKDSALDRAGVLHPPDQDGMATPREPAELTQMLSSDELRRKSSAELWTPSHGPRVVLPHETAMRSRPVPSDIPTCAMEAREDHSTVVEAIARQRSERSLSNPLAPQTVQDVGGAGRRSSETALW